MNEAKRHGWVRLTLVLPDGTRKEFPDYVWISADPLWFLIGEKCEAELDDGDIWIQVLNKSGPSGTTILAKQVDDPKRFIDDIDHCFRFRGWVKERATLFKSLSDDSQKEQLRKMLVGKRDALDRLAESRIKTGNLVYQEQADDERSWVVAIEDILAILITDPEPTTHMES